MPVINAIASAGNWRSGTTAANRTDRDAPMVIVELPIPAGLDYVSLPGLSNEMVERLSLARPATLGAAARVRGVTPAALAAILVHARRRAA